MLAMTFGLNSFPNTNLRFLGNNILGLDLFLDVMSRPIFDCLELEPDSPVFNMVVPILIDLNLIDQKQDMNLQVFASPNY